MSEIWNFSPSLEDHVRQCITAARTEENNKWLKRFGSNNYNLKPVLDNEINTPVNSDENTKNNIQNANVGVLQQLQEQQNEITDENLVRNIDEIAESLETEVATNFDVMVKLCVDNHTLLTALATRLSTHTIEKLCVQIYDKKDTNRKFLIAFFDTFLTAYVKREYNSSTLDILVRASKCYPIEFRLLLKNLVKDVGIPNTVLQDFILTLNEHDLNKFVKELAELDLTDEEFINNLFPIYTAYKNCSKSNQIQNYVHAMLSQYSSSCVSDRNYGRLFLTFLQAQKGINAPVNYESLEKILEVHRSPFRRPCLTLINELAGKGDGVPSSEED